jgi:TonB family protein
MERDGQRWGRIGLALGLALGLVLGLALGSGAAGFAQGAGVATNAVDDAALVTGQRLVGKALFLRGFYAANELRYDVQGRVLGNPKVGDWTVAGVNVLKVESRAGEMELDGVRVAIRYNAEQHQFERHLLNDEKVKILVGLEGGSGAADAKSGGTKSFEAAVAAIFAVGIDPALQRSMPECWQHYFNPGLEWPADALTGVTVYPTFGLPNQAKDVVPAKGEHKAEVKFTNFAERDRVKGMVLLRMVVDAEGVPRRIAIVQPLGYGLDERAVEAMAKWRFAPGTREGKAVATGVVVAQDFAVGGQPGR